jgi:hypothetical protein
MRLLEDEAAMQEDRPAAGPVGRVVLAALLAGAAGTHFAMAPAHADEWLAEGLAFAATGWAQVVLAVAVVVRPTRRVLALGILLNLLVLGAYLLSRTAGLPVGPESGQSDPFAFIDVLTAVLEGLFVAGSAFALAAPAREGTSRWRPVPVVAGVSVLVVAGLTSGALASPSAREHAHGGEEEEEEPAAVAAGDHDHGTAAATPAGRDDQATAEAVNVGGVVDPENIPEGAEPGTGSGHGHSGVSPWQFIEDRATRDLLGQQLTTAREAALRYPTAADAQAAGYHQSTPYVPRIGAHWLKPSALGNGFDPGEPEMLLYDGNGLDARIVGLSYLGLTNPETPPEGFAGPNDPWHQHIGLCLRGTTVVGDVNTSEEECRERGGSKTALDDLWMAHAWVVPGWESAWGIFSAEHPDLR